MSTVLRLSGTEFNVEVAMASTSLEPCAVRRKGGLRFPKSQTNTSVFESSGLNFLVSDAGFHEFEFQVDDAIEFLESQFDELKPLLASPGIDEAWLGFGVAKRDVVAQVDLFPSRLIRLAGALGLGIEVSQYPVSSSGSDSESASNE